jgi:intraflagellar transport protein 74
VYCRIAEYKEKQQQCDEEMLELENEFEDQAGEKNEKYRELRAKEQQIDEFLTSYDGGRQQEMTRINELHKQITHTLLVIARNYEQQVDEYFVWGVMEGFAG